MSQKPNTTLKLNEKGFASIVIALILIIVLALLTVGFAQLARREQQNALDKQKATQATYAAESGINDAYRDIQANLITTDGGPGQLQANDQNCMVPPAGYTGKVANPNINANTGVSYSCLLVQLNTSNLQFDNLAPGSGRHITFGTQDPLGSLKLSWGSATGRTNFKSSAPAPDNPAQFTTLANWQGPPVVEFSITPTSGLAGASDPNKYLQDNTFTFYAYPSSGGSNSLDYNVSDASKQGQVVSGACSGTGGYPCSVTLNGLSGQQFVIHIVDFYDTSNLLITGDKAGGGATTFSGEPIIDVTGKARDVLKRLRVRVLVNNGNSSSDDSSILPNGAVEAQNLCKRIQAAPPTADFPQGSTYDGLDSSCNLTN